jgi:hypothetical protein
MCLLSRYTGTVVVTESPLRNGSIHHNIYIYRTRTSDLGLYIFETVTDTNVKQHVNRANTHEFLLATLIVKKSAASGAPIAIKGKWRLLDPLHPQTFFRAISTCRHM